MRRTDILVAAEQCISRDRHDAYGPAEDSFAAIAGHWNWWLDGRLTSPLTPHDVAMMMAGLKQARIRGHVGHPDSYVDLAGYAALGGEIGSAEAQRER